MIDAATVVALLRAATASTFWTVGGTGGDTGSAEKVALVTLTPETATKESYRGVSVKDGRLGCEVAALSDTTQSNGVARWFVLAGSTLDLTNTVGLTTGGAPECQGATITVYLLAAP